MSNIIPTTIGTYQPISSAALLRELQAELGARGLTDERDYTIQYSKTEGKGTMHLVTLQFKEAMFINGDHIRPRICWFNSYAGECRLNAFLGFFRAICANGMIFGDSIFSELVTHRTGPMCEDKIARLVPDLVAGVEHLYANFADEVSELTARSVSTSTAIEVIGSLNLSDRVKQKSLEKLFFGRQEDMTGNLWGLWNIVNEQIRVTGRSPVRIMERNVGLLKEIQGLVEHTEALQDAS